MEPGAMLQSFDHSQPGVVTEAMIRDVVHAFYARVLVDPEIGLFFAHHLPGRWQVHVDHLIGIWMVATHDGELPVGWPHDPHGILRLTERQINRWLALFCATISDLCPPSATAILLDRVATIGSSFRVGLGLASVPRRSAGTPS